MGEGDGIFSIILNANLKMKTYLYIIYILVLPSFLFSQKSPSEKILPIQKLTNHSSFFIKKNERSEKYALLESSKSFFKISAHKNKYLAEVLLKCKNKHFTSYSKLISPYHIQVGSVHYINCKVDIDDLVYLINDNDILEIELEKRKHIELNETPKLIGADKVWTGNIDQDQLITGKEVYIGIIENDIPRFTHESFKDSNGNNRIEQIWDFSDDTNCGPPFNCLNQNYLYGEDSNHATHVGTIAAGSKFEAKLPRLLNDKMVQGIAPDSKILYGVNGSYLKAINEMVKYVNGKPLVINISLGASSLGPKDGSTLTERAIDELLERIPNLTIIKSAGNSSIYTKDCGSSCPYKHIRVNGSTNQKAVVDFTIYKDSAFCEIWHDNAFMVQFKSKDGSWKSEIINNGLNRTQKIVLPNTTPNQEDTILISNHTEYNNSKVISIQVTSRTGNTLLHKDLLIELTPTITTPYTIDGYTVYENTGAFQSGFPNGDNEQTITEPGYAKNVITVASFNTHENQEISYFSSSGPLRKGTTIKPNITAPGAFSDEESLTSSLRSYFTITNGILSAGAENDEDGSYLRGTSMSAPHVTGAVALILEHFDNIPNYQIKTLLEKTADKVANGDLLEQKIRWGAGKLNVLAAYQQLIGFDGTDVEKPIAEFQKTFEKFKDNAGLPIGIVQNLGNSIHRFQPLTNGILFQNGNSAEVFWLGQEIWNQWKCIGSVNSEIGLPIASQETDEGILSDDFIVRFEQCSLIFDGSNDQVIVNDNCSINIVENCLENLAANLSNSMLEQNGENIQVNNLEIINTGSENIQIKIPIHFYLSKDESPDESDYFIIEKNISKLKAGAKENISFNFNLSTIDIPPGEYFLGFKIDPKNELQESKEGDNQYAWTTPKILVANEVFSCNNSILVNCGEIYSGTTKGGIYSTESYEIINWKETGPEKVHAIQIDSPGDIVASITTLDENNNATEDHDLDVFILDECNTNSVVAFDDKNAVLKNAAPGTYYIVVDGYNGDQGNYELLVTCGNDKPNLTVDNATSQIVVTPTTLAFNLNIKNTSCSVPANASKVKIVLSPDIDFIDNLNPNEDKIIINQEISFLEPEGVFQIQEQFDISDFNITPGLYYLGITIDYTDQVSESEEEDNDFFWKNPENRVVVVRGGAPNLRLLFTEGQSQVDGSQVIYSGKVVNLEDVPSGDFSVGFYLAEKNPHGNRGHYDDYFLGDASVDGIGTNSNSSFNFLADAASPTLGIPPGFYYLSWVVDYKDEVDETDEPGSFFWTTGKIENRVSVSASSYCTGTTILTEDQGLFSDNSLDGNYENNTYCQWLIKPIKPSEKIYLQFSNLDLGNGDEIEVFNGSYEGSSSLARLNSSSSPVEIIGTNNSMLVRFTSNSSNTGNGFEASYSIESKGFCNSNTVFTKPSGIISDGSGCENYNNNTDCSWIITPVEHDKSIFLEFSEFDLAEDDFVRIYDGTTIDEEKLMATYTGVNIPSTFRSKSDKILVRFTSNGLNTRQGFEAVYNLIEVEKDNSIPSLEEFNLGSSLNTESLSFNLTFSKDEEYEVVITNILGQEFYREKFFGRGSVKTIDINTLENGYYFIYAYNREGINTKKFLVVK